MTIHSTWISDSTQYWSFIDVHEQINIKHPLRGNAGVQNCRQLDTHSLTKHNNDYVQLCSAGQEYSYCTWKDVNVAVFFSPRHSEPLKKFKSLEMSQSNVFVGKEKPKFEN